MLRAILFGIGVLMLAAALWLFLIGAAGRSMIPAVILGLMLTIGIAYERIHYKSLAARRPGPGWQRTDERFIDPATGKKVTVYFRAADGERMYVEEQQP